MPHTHINRYIPVDMNGKYKDVFINKNSYLGARNPSMNFSSN